MTPVARRSLIAAFALLTVAGLLRSCGSVHEMSQTTRSPAPWGFGAFYELCERLWPETRRLDAVETSSTTPVWWLRPAARCGTVDDETDDPWPLRDFVAGGGTAVVPLPLAMEGFCELDTELPLPSFAQERAEREGPITSPDLDRDLRTPLPLRVFDVPADPWRVVASVAGAPFVMERRVGSGHVVVLSDPRIFTNAHLGDGDAAPIGAWVASMWGPPAFDDGTAGPSIGGPITFIARSPAAAVIVALALAGLLVVWHGMLVPSRTIVIDDGLAPRLNDVARSFGRLLARSRDLAGILESHRAWAVSTLAPALGLPRHAAPSDVVQRLCLVRGAEEAALLQDESIPTDRAELDRRLAAITTLVEDVTT